MNNLLDLTVVYFPDLETTRRKHFMRYSSMKRFTKWLEDKSINYEVIYI